MTIRQRPAVTITEFLGVDFTLLDEAETCAWILARSAAAQFAYVVTPNVDHVVQLDRDPALRPCYAAADLRLCDSMILALLAKRSGIDLPVVKGSDLTERLLDSPLPTGLRLALVGGDAAQVAWLRRKRPDLTISHLVPPMGLRRDPAARAAVADFVETAQAAITLLTVGAPQSELIAHLIAERGRAGGVALCVGASLEFLTGKKRRAPVWLQHLRLEWAFRLLAEPRRLWRRYLVEGPRIFVIWRRWSQTQSPRPNGGGGLLR